MKIQSAIVTKNRIGSVFNYIYMLQFAQAGIAFWKRCSPLARYTRHMSASDKWNIEFHSFQFFILQYSLHVLVPKYRYWRLLCRYVLYSSNYSRFRIITDKYSGTAQRYSIRWLVKIAKLGPLHVCTDVSDRVLAGVKCSVILFDDAILPDLLLSHSSIHPYFSDARCKRFQLLSFHFGIG